MFPERRERRSQLESGNVRFVSIAGRAAPTPARAPDPRGPATTPASTGALESGNVRFAASRAGDCGLAIGSRGADARSSAGPRGAATPARAPDPRGAATTPASTGALESGNVRFAGP